MSLLVEPDDTREDLATALANVNALAKRCPTHYTDEWARWHAQLDMLLTEWELR